MDYEDKTDGPAVARTDKPLSPCTLICTLDDDKRCLGCGRTLAQISSWALMSAEEQWAVIDELAAQGDDLQLQSQSE